MPIEKSERRLDALAEIMECRSACVAIVCVNSQFLITANEFTLDSARTDEQYAIINKVMGYFKSIAEGLLVSIDSRDTIMLEICKLRLESLGKGRLDLSDDAVSTFINSNRMVGRGFPPEISECEGLSGSDLFPKVLAAYGTMRGIYKSIIKIEDGIKDALSSTYGSITREQLDAFKAFETSSVLRKKQGERGTNVIHAELQILIELIRRNIGKSIYIGISKRCCFDCHCMIDAANAVFTRNSSILLRIKTRGDAHDGKEKNFYLPENIFDSTTLFGEIKTEYLRLLGSERTPAPKFKTHQHSESASEASEGEFGKRNKYKIFIEERKRLFEELKETPEITIGMHKQILELADSLYGSGMFDSFFMIDNFTSEQDLSAMINAFFQKCVENTIDLNNLHIMLELHYFPIIHEDLNQQQHLVCLLQSKLSVLISTNLKKQKSQKIFDIQRQPNEGLLNKYEYMIVTEKDPDPGNSSEVVQSASTSDSTPPLMPVKSKLNPNAKSWEPTKKL